MREKMFSILFVAAVGSTLGLAVFESFTGSLQHQNSTSVLQTLNEDSSGSTTSLVLFGNW